MLSVGVQVLCWSLGRQWRMELINRVNRKVYGNLWYSLLSARGSGAGVVNRGVKETWWK